MGLNRCLDSSIKTKCWERGKAIAATMSLSPSTMQEIICTIYVHARATVKFLLFFLSCLASLKQIFFSSNLHIVLTKRVHKGLSFLFTCNSFFPCFPLMFISLYVQYSLSLMFVTLLCDCLFITVRCHVNNFHRNFQEK